MVIMAQARGLVVDGRRWRVPSGSEVVEAAGFGGDKQGALGEDRLAEHLGCAYRQGGEDRPGGGAGLPDRPAVFGAADGGGVAADEQVAGWPVPDRAGDALADAAGGPDGEPFGGRADPVGPQRLAAQRAGRQRVVD